MSWRIPCSLPLLFWLAALPVQADEPQLSPGPSGAPEGVPPAVAESLSPSSLEVKLGEKVHAQFWFRKELPTRAGASGDLGVSYGQLTEGTLVGAVRFERPWADYKNNSVPAGTYTLRYGIQPADGNHMGVSFYRDFLLIIPAGKDPGSSEPGSKELVALSQQSTGTNHPAVLALFPAAKSPSEPQVARNDLDQWMLVVPLGEVTLGLVIEGHGELEGY